MNLFLAVALLPELVASILSHAENLRANLSIRLSPRNQYFKQGSNFTRDSFIGIQEHGSRPVSHSRMVLAERIYFRLRLIYPIYMAYRY
jgi:hypothetical protein